MKIDFEFETPHGVFRDAIHLPDDHGFTETEITQMKQDRVDNWIAIVTAPASPEPATTVEVGGEVYQKLEGVPPSGARLVEVEGTWYYRT